MSSRRSSAKLGRATATDYPRGRCGETVRRSRSGRSPCIANSCSRPGSSRSSESTMTGKRDTSSARGRCPARRQDDRSGSPVHRLSSCSVLRLDGRREAQREEPEASGADAADEGHGRTSCLAPEIRALMRSSVWNLRKAVYWTTADHSTVREEAHWTASLPQLTAREMDGHLSGQPIMTRSQTGCHTVLKSFAVQMSPALDNSREIWPSARRHCRTSGSAPRWGRLVTVAGCAVARNPHRSRSSDRCLTPFAQRKAHASRSRRPPA